MDKVIPIFEGKTPWKMLVEVEKKDLQKRKKVSENKRKNKTQRNQKKKILKVSKQTLNP